MKKFYIIFFVILIIVGCSKTELLNNDYPLAKIGKTTFYKSQFDKLYINVINDNMDEKELLEKADTVFRNTMRQFAAYEYLKDDTMYKDKIRKIYEDSKRSQLLKAVYEDLVTNKIKVTEQEAKEYFLRENTTVWAQHLMVDLDQKKLADSLYKVLKVHPEKFEELIGKYSTDKTTNKNKGNLKPFSGGKFVKPFEDACMNQPIGVIGKPIETIFGYHIIRVNRRERKDISNFEKKKAAIIQELKDKKRKKLEKKSLEYIKSLGHLKTNDNNIDSLLKYAKKDNLGDIILDSLPNNIRSLQLCTSSFGTWTIDSVISTKEKLAFGTLPLTNLKAVKNYIEGMVFWLSLYDRGARMGVQFNRDAENERILKTAIYIQQEYIKNLKKSINKSDSILINYYKKNPEKYSTKAKVGVYIICNPDSAKVYLINDSLKLNKKPFKEYSRLYSTIKPKEFSRPPYHYYDEDDTLGYYKKAMKTGLNNVSDIFKNRLGYNIIKVVEIVPSQVEDFKKVKRTVMYDYERHVLDSLFDEYYKVAKDSLGYVFYENNYKKLKNEIITKAKEKK